FNTNLGIEYFLNEQSSLTASVFYRYGQDEDITTNQSERFKNNILAEETLRKELETEEDNRYQFALNYMNKLGENGHQLTADFQVGKSNEVTTGFINEDVVFNINNETTRFLQEQIDSKQDQTEYLIQADYVLPIGEDSQFEAGYRGDFENTVTDYELRTDPTVPGNFEINLGLSNVFDYTENVNAIYTQYGSKFGKFSYLLGLRLENTQLKGVIDSRLSDEELVEEFGFPIDTD